jgi:pimeloyl-ACP methyl ester carboxylesterase
MEFVPLKRRQRVGDGMPNTARWFVLILGLLVAMQPSGLLPAQGTSSQSGESTSNRESTSNEESSGMWLFNLKTKTLGGQQFWTDLRHATGWRIQRNEVTGQHRLIDATDHRVASGTFEQCDNQLDEAINNGKAFLHEGELVIVLHGLLRSRRSMNKLSGYLRTEGNYQVINLEYASSRKPVAVHAAALRQVIDSLGPKVTRIHLVGHSLGNLVIRHYLADTTDPETGLQGDPRIGRIVMIGPPNQGSKMAEWLKHSFLFGTIAGVSGAQLATGWSELEPKLATPKMEFGIIAGAQSDAQKLNNVILKGPDDFTVRLEETKLVGAKDFLVEPLYHGTMMKQPVVLEATRRFLKHGYFVTESQMRPVTTLQED